MALDSDSDSGSGALLGVIVGALLIGAVALFAFGAFDPATTRDTTPANVETNVPTPDPAPVNP